MRERVILIAGGTLSTASWILLAIGGFALLDSEAPSEFREFAVPCLVAGVVVGVIAGPLITLAARRMELSYAEARRRAMRVGLVGLLVSVPVLAVLLLALEEIAGWAQTTTLSGYFETRSEALERVQERAVGIQRSVTKLVPADVDDWRENFGALEPRRLTDLHFGYLASMSGRGIPRGPHGNSVEFLMRDLLEDPGVDFEDRYGEALEFATWSHLHRILRYAGKAPSSWSEERADEAFTQVLENAISLPYFGVLGLSQASMAVSRGGSHVTPAQATVEVVIVDLSTMQVAAYLRYEVESDTDFSKYVEFFIDQFGKPPPGEYVTFRAWERLENEASTELIEQLRTMGAHASFDSE